MAGSAAQAPPIAEKVAVTPHLSPLRAVRGHSAPTDVPTDAASDGAPTFSLVCPFCPELGGSRYEYECGSVVALRDGFPVTEGHYLVIPVRHTPDFFSMTERERADADRLLEYLAVELTKADPSIVGFNIGMNCGMPAGQTVPHAHTHLIPRRRGDTPHPRGGVRGVIPAKMDY